MNSNLIDAIPGFIIWKDSKSIYHSGNTAGAKLIGLKHREELAGLTDKTLPNGPSEFSETFIQQDLEVIHQKTTLKFLDVHHYALGKRIFLTTKTPVFSESKCIGTCCHMIDLTNTPVQKIVSSLYQKYNKKQHNSFSLRPRTGEILSKKEFEVLFYLLHGKTASEIANILHRSQRTVECHLCSIKSKFNAQNKSELIEAAIEQGYLDQIPHWLLKQNLSTKIS